jgi:hypothetical protein
MSLHQDLPPGVHPYPTLKGKQRFEMLQVFNVALAIYLLIHKLIMPLMMSLAASTSARRTPEFGAWYLYHIALAVLLKERWRTPRTAFITVYLAWFGAGFLPPALVASLLDHGTVKVGWLAISGILCYGSSLIFTLFLLYRLRMPTTAYLFQLPDRIIPRWRYALPYAAIGLALGLWLATRERPAAASDNRPVPAARPPPRRSPYE